MIYTGMHDFLSKGKNTGVTEMNKLDVNNVAPNMIYKGISSLYTYKEVYTTTRKPQFTEDPRSWVESSFCRMFAQVSMRVSIYMYVKFFKVLAIHSSMYIFLYAFSL